MEHQEYGSIYVIGVFMLSTFKLGKFNYTVYSPATIHTCTCSQRDIQSLKDLLVTLWQIFKTKERPVIFVAFYWHFRDITTTSFAPASILFYCKCCWDYEWGNIFRKDNEWVDGTMINYHIHCVELDSSFVINLHSFSLENSPVLYLAHSSFRYWNKAFR